MASKCNVCDVVVLDNPSKFTADFRLDITFECYENLNDDLEWKLIYVGEADNNEKDQLLDSVLVGPIPEGKHQFQFTAPAADASKLPSSDIVGVAVLLLTCSYRNQEFIKIGYYVANQYSDPQLLDNPPDNADLDKLTRTILTDDVRITRLPIKWDEADEQAAEEVQQPLSERNGVEEPKIDEQTEEKVPLRDDSLTPMEEAQATSA